MASIRKRGDKWFAEVRLKGRSVSKMHLTKAEAKDWAQTEERKIRVMKGDGVIEGKTLGDAFERYAREESPQKKGSRWETIRLEKLGRDKIASIQLSDLDAEDFDGEPDGWIFRQRGAGLSDSSIKRELQLISPVLKLCRRKWKWMEGNPLLDVEKPKEGKPRTKLISDKEIKDIISALQYVDSKPVVTVRQKIAVAFLFAIETAMRQGEIWKLEWSHIDWEEYGAKLFDTKNGEDREVPLSPKAIELLKKLTPTESGKVFAGMSQEVAGVIFRRAVEIAGYKDTLTFHDARHLATTRLAEKFDMLALSTITGHKDPRMLKRYYNPKVKTLAMKLRAN